MKRMYLTIILLSLAVVGIAQDTLAKKAAKDTVKKQEQPIADTVMYITNEDLAGIYRYIGDRVTGTQYFQIFSALDGAIREAQRKAADRYRKKKKK